jgi:hypothetical protein
MRTSPENLGKVRETAQIDTIILRLQPLANLALSLSRHLSQPDSSDFLYFLKNSCTESRLASWYFADQENVPLGG